MKEKISKPRQVLAVTANELALAIAVSPRHVWHLNAEGKLPRPIRLGTSVRWNVSEIAAWLDCGCPDLKTWEKIKKENNKERKC
jgi:predicted DNA-binding transcriptional regulator AlpA